MIEVKLPDGSVRKVKKGITSFEIAQSISEGLARQVLAAEINGEIWDINREINEDVDFKLLTFKDNKIEEPDIYLGAGFSKLTNLVFQHIRNSHRKTTLRCVRGSFHK